MNITQLDGRRLQEANGSGSSEVLKNLATINMDNIPGIVLILPKCFYAICIIGIALNIVVFWHRKSASRKQSPTTKLSLSLLCAMAAADTVSLSSLLIMLCSRYFGLPPHIMSALCKLDVFFIHAASAFSIWCWLVLSAVRYVAIYRPYSHLTLRKEPMMAAFGVGVLCGVLEAWILVIVVYDRSAGGCRESIEPWLLKPLHLFEIAWSYFIPLLVITFLDVKVLCCRSVWFTGLATTQLLDRPSASLSHKENVQKCDSSTSALEGTIKHARSNRRVLQLKVLRRCLCITILDLGMNLPNYVLRLYVNTLSDEELMNMSYSMMVFEAISQLLYFAQFACNAVYLACIIYDAPKQTADSSNGVRLNYSNSRYSSNGLPRKVTVHRPSINPPLFYDSILNEDKEDKEDKEDNTNVNLIPC